MEVGRDRDVTRSNVSTFGKRLGGGRRRTSRQPLPLIAVFTTRTRSHHAVVADLSDTGVRLKGDLLPQCDEDVMLSIEGMAAYGFVVWARSGFCGIQFDAPLMAGQMKALQHRVMKAGGLSPELLAAMDDWTLGLAR